MDKMVRFSVGDIFSGFFGGLQAFGATQVKDANGNTLTYNYALAPTPNRTMTV